MTDEDLSLNDDYGGEGVWDDEALVLDNTNLTGVLDNTAAADRNIGWFYEILSKEKLWQHLSNTFEEISKKIDYSPSSCMTMLRHNGWDKDKLLDSYFDGQTHQFFSRASMIDPKDVPMPDPTYAECQICTLEGVLIGFNCYDLFCADCWRGHINAKISSGDLKIQCMDAECNFIADDSFVVSVISENEDNMRAYRELIMNSYIANEKHVRRCPGPNCKEYTVRVETIRCETIRCYCGHSFCFKCAKESHEPINCDIEEAWVTECKQALNDGSALDWMSQNSKPCPNCKVQIEKSSGCNHMTCKNPGCNHQFCWLCFQDWTSHKQNSCNRFSQEAVNRRAADIEKRKANYDRYKHYFERYLNHKNSMEMEKKLYDRVKESICDHQGFQDGDVGGDDSEFAFAKNAIDVLIDSRRTLMATYTFGFYLSRDGRTEVFEHNQEQLEYTTEELSHLLGNYFVFNEWARLKILRQQNLVSSYRDVLLKHCREGIDSDNWKFSTDVDKVVGNL